MSARPRTGRVVVTVRVDAGGGEPRLQPPPDLADPSERWAQKFARALRPVEGEPGAFRCSLPGDLLEIAGHLWQHQRLYLLLKGAHGQGSERHLAVQLSEVLDPYA